MNIEQIKSFVSIVQNGNFTVAAKGRFISQPTISNQMRQLEEEVGKQLFVRNAHMIVPTDYGMEFYRHACKLIAAEQDFYSNIQNQADGKYGIFDVGVPFLTLFELLDEFFIEMIKTKREAGVVTRVVEKVDEDIPGMILCGDLELGVANYIIDNNELIYEEAFTEEIFLITPNEERYQNLTREQIIYLLLNEGHIRYDFGKGSDFLWNDFFGKILGCNLHNVQTVARTSYYGEQLAAVEAGLGIGFISSICAQKPMREHKILAYRCKALLEKKHYVVYSKRRAESSPIIRYAKDLLLKTLKDNMQLPELSF